MRDPRKSKPRPLGVSLTRFSSALAICGALLASVDTAKAATLRWDANLTTGGPQDAAGTFVWNAGQATFWNTTTLSNVAATSGDIAQFADNVSLGGVATIQTQTQTIAGIIFGATTSNGYSLTGTAFSGVAAPQVLTIGASGVTVNNNNSAPSTAATLGSVGVANTVNPLSIRLAGAQTFINRSSGLLNVAGAVDNNNSLLTVETTTIGRITFASGISGTGGLKVNDTVGEVTVGGAGGGATYSGQTNLSTSLAKLAIGAASTLPGGITGPGNLIIAAGSANTVAVGATVNYTGTTTLTSGTLRLDGGGDAPLTGVITGPGNLNINNGVNTATLSGQNGYAGVTTLTSGRLVITNGGTSNTVSPLGVSTLVFTGGTFDIPAAAPITLLTNNAQTWSAGGSFTFGGSNSLNLGSGAVSLPTTTNPNVTGRTITVAANTLTAGGLISGAGSFTKAGAGELSLSGLNSFSGGIILNAGTLNINEGGVPDTSNPANPANARSAIGTGPLVINGGTINNTRGASVTIQSTGTQNWNADFTFAGINSLHLGAGNVVLGAGSNRQITVNANVLTVGGIISSATSPTSLTKLGSGALTLGGANTFTGGVTLSQGTLNINNANALGTTAGTFTIAPNTTIDNTTTGSITTSNYPLIFSGNFTFAGSNSLNLGAGATSIVNSSREITVNANTLTLGGVISGATTFGLTKWGAGTLVLNNNNTFGGAASNATQVILKAGTLSFGNANAFGNSAAGTANTLVIEGGALDSSANSLTLNAYPQRWNGDFTFLGTQATTSLGNGTVTLNANRIVTVNANTLTVGGVISGATFGLTKAGPGTLILSGSMTGGYTGVTKVSGGTLQLNANTIGSTLPTTGVSLTGDGIFNLSNTGAGATITRSFSSAPLSFAAGDGSVRLTRAAGQNLTLSFASLTARAPGATGTFSAITNNSVLGSTNARITFTSTPSTGLGAPLGPGYFATNLDGTGLDSGFAFLDATAANGVRVINYTGDTTYAGTFTGPGATVGPLNTNKIVKVTGEVTAQVTQTLTDLHLASNNPFTLGAGATLTLQPPVTGADGGLLKTGGGAATISGGNGITAGTGGELIIRTDTAADALTLSTPILANTGAVTKSGPGTLILNSANAFTGTLYVSGGVLSVSADNQLGGGSNPVVLNVTPGSLATGLLATNSFSTAHPFVLNQPANPIAVTLGNTLTSTAPLQFAVSPSTPVVTNGLVKNDSGTLVLGGNNSTWTGNITINNGALRGDTVATSLGSSSGNITVANPSAALQLAGNQSYGKSGGIVTLNSSGINNAGALENFSGNNTWSSLLTLGSATTIGSTSGELTITGAFAGAQALTLAGAGDIKIASGLFGTSPSSITKIGTGTATLTANSSNYPGNITINGGTFAISGSGVQIGGGGTLTVNPSASLTVNDSNGAASVHLGGRSLTLVGGNFSYTGNVANSAETAAVLTINPGQSTFSSNRTGAGTNTLTFASLSFAGDSAVVFSGADLGTSNNRLFFSSAPGLTNSILPRAIVTSGGGFDFATYATTGATPHGIQAFTNYNQTAGSATNVNSAGTNDTLLVTNATANTIFTAATKTINALKISGTPPNLSGPTTALTVTSGGIIVTGGSNTIDLLNLAFGGTQVSAHVDAGAALEIASILTGSGGLVKADGGTLTLSPPSSVLSGVSGNLNFTGNHVVANGVLKLNGGNNTIAPNQFLRVGAGGTLDLNGNFQYFRGILTDSSVATPALGALGMITSSVGSATLVINQDNNTRPWAGNITGNVYVARSGENTLNIYSNNDYTGGTLINGGTTILRDQGQISGTGGAGIEINYATLQIDNSTAGSTADLSNRVANDKAITLRGGTVFYLGRANTNSTESLGGLTLEQGGSSIRVDSGAASTGQAASAELTFSGSLARSGQATVNFNSTGTLGLAGNTSAPRIKFSTPPTLTRNLIGPWAVDKGTEWASYLAGTGEGALNTTGFVGYDGTTIPVADQPTQNIRVTSTAALTNRIINSLNLVNVGATFTAGTVLNLVSGGLLKSGNNPHSIGAAVGDTGSLTAGGTPGSPGSTVDLYLYNNQNVLTVHSRVIDNTAGSDNKVRLVLWSANGGTTTLTNFNNNYSGGTTVNGPSMTVNLNGVNAGAGTDYVIPAATNPADGLVISGATVQMVNSLTVDQQIHPSNIVTLNGASRLTLFGDNTFAGLVLNNNGGSTVAPTVSSASKSANEVEKASGKLTLGGSGLVVNASNVTATATITGLLDMGTSPNTITVNPTLVNGIDANPLQPGLIVNALVGSSGGITKEGAGVLQFNLQTTFTGALNVNAGGIQYSQTNAGSRFSDVTLFGDPLFPATRTRLNLNGVSTVIGSLAGGGRVINTVGGTQTLTVGFSGVDPLRPPNIVQTFSGTIERLSDASTGTVNLTKIGKDTLVFTGTANSIGNLTVQGGTMRYSGNGVSDFLTHTLQGGSTLELDNSVTNVNNRLGGAVGPNSGTITANGGSFTIKGSSAGTLESIGIFTITNGGSVITLDANPSGTLKVNVGNFTAYSPGGSALFRGLAPTTGTDAPFPTPGPGLGNFTIPGSTLNAPAGAGIGTNGSREMPIRPDLIGDLSKTGLGTAFVTQDSFGAFLRPLSPGVVGDEVQFPNEMANTLTTPSELDGLSTKNYSFTTDQPITTNTNANSVVLSSGGAITGTLPAAFGLNGGSGSPLTQQITSGGILGLPGNGGIHVGLITTGSANSSGTLFFHALGNMDVTGYLASGTGGTGAGGLVKAGAGTLTLNSAAFYGGPTTINQGTLVLNSGQDFSISVLPTANIPTVSTLNANGGVIDLKGNSQAFGPLVVNNVVNGVSVGVTNGDGGTIHNSGALATLTSAAGATDSYFSGKITGALNFVKSGSSTLTLSGAGNTFQGALRIRGGGLRVRDSGALPNVGSVELFFGALTLDQTGLGSKADIMETTPRLPPTVPVNSLGGTFTLQGGNTLDSTASVGNFSLLGGLSTISNGTPNTGSGATSVLTIGNLLHSANAGAMVNFTVTSGGGTLGAVTLNNPQTILSNYNTASVTANNNIIGGWAVVNGDHFATYKDDRGVGALSDTTNTFLGYDGTDLSSGATTGTQNINDSTSRTLSTSKAVNALRMAPTSGTQTLTIGTGVTLTLNSGGLLTNGTQAINFVPAVAGDTTSAITSGGGELYAFVNQNTTTLGVKVTGSINLVKGGGGTLAITANNLNAYSGLTIVNQGTLSLRTNLNDAVSPADGVAVFAIPGGLVINNATTALSSAGQIKETSDVTLNGGGVLNMSGTKTLQTTPSVITTVVSNTVRSITFNGTGGNGTPTVTAASSLIVTAANAITSNNDNLSTTPIISGTSLALSSATPTISTSGFSPNGLVIQTPIHNVGGQLVKSGSGSVVLNPTVPIATVTDGATGTSPTIKLATTLGLAEGMNVTGTNIPAGTRISAIVNGTDITLSNPVGGTGPQTPTLNFAGSTFGSATGGFRLDSGTVILAANTTGTAGAVINGPLGTGTLTFNGGSVASDGTTIRTILNPVTVTGNMGLGLASSTAGVGIAGNGVIVASDVTFTAGAHDIEVNDPLNISTINGRLIGTNATLSKSGTGTLLLNNSANNWGSSLPVLSLAVNGGVLRKGDADAVPGGLDLSIAQKALFDVAGTDQVVRSLSGGGAITNSGAATKTLFAGGTTSTDNTTVVNSTFDGAIGDSSILGSSTNRLGLTKVGLGTLTLGGENVYLGSTLVKSGTLKVSISGSIAGRSAVTVSSGATLEMNGVIGTGGSASMQVSGTLRGVGTVGPNVDILNLGVLAPGNDAATDGNMVFNKTVTLGANSTYIFGARADDLMSNRIKLEGASSDADLSGGSGKWTLRLANFGVGDPTGLEFIIVDGDAGASSNVNGGVDPTSDNVNIVAGTSGWDVSNAYLYFEFGGNDIILAGVMIPEPNSACLLLSGLGYALGIRRLRRKSGSKRSATKAS